MPHRLVPTAQHTQPRLTHAILQNQPTIFSFQIEDFLLGAPLPAAVQEEGPPPAASTSSDSTNSNSSSGGGAALPLYDWWGSMREARRRGPERLSIIFAFDDPR